MTITLRVGLRDIYSIAIYLTYYAISIMSYLCLSGYMSYKPLLKVISAAVMHHYFELHMLMWYWNTCD